MDINRDLSGRFGRWFAARPFARNMALLAGGTAIAQVATVIAAPAITRLYSPEAVGLFGVFMAFTGIAAVVACGRYDLAIVSAKNRTDAALLTTLAAGIAAPATVACAFLFLLFIVRQWFGFGAFPAYMAAVAGAAAFLTAVFTALRYWFVREEDFSFIGRFSAAQGITRAIGQVAFGFVIPAAGGLIAGDVLGRLVGIFASLRRTAATVRAEVAAAGRGALRRVAAAYREFPQYSLPSSLIDSLALQLPVPLLAQLYSVSLAGELTLVQRLLGLPVAFIGASVADAFHGRAAAHLRDAPDQVRGLFLRTARALFLSGLGPILLIMAVSPAAFGWIFGEEWRGAGTLAAIIAPLALVQLTVSSVSRIVTLVEGGPRMKLVYDVLAIALAIGCLLAGRAAGLAPYTAVALYAGGQIAAYVLYFVLMLKMIATVEGTSH